MDFLLLVKSDGGLDGFHAPVESSEYSQFVTKEVVWCVMSPAGLCANTDQPGVGLLQFLTVVDIEMIVVVVDCLSEVMGVEVGVDCILYVLRMYL